MSDVDRLKEVVDRATVQVEHGIPLMPSVAHALLAAARLMVAGQPLSRCEAHGLSSCPAKTYTHHCPSAHDNPATPCRMVEGVWVPTGKDET